MDMDLHLYKCIPILYLYMMKIEVSKGLYSIKKRTGVKDEIEHFFIILTFYITLNFIFSPISVIIVTSSPLL